MAWLARRAGECPEAAQALGEAAALMAEVRLLRAALERVRAACGTPAADAVRDALAVATEALRP
jgi:hypothetical protein